MRFSNISNPILILFLLYRQPIEWDRDISALDGQEILVETRERFPIQTSISHNYVNKLICPSNFTNIELKIHLAVKQN